MQIGGRGTFGPVAIIGSHRLIDVCSSKNVSGYRSRWTTPSCACSLT